MSNHLLKWIIIIKYIIFYWAIVYAMFYLFQREMIYAPNKHNPRLNHYDEAHLQILSWYNRDKIKLFGYYIPAQQKNLGNIVIFHGNAGHIGTRKTLMYKLAELGYGVFMPEYRGYGGNQGRPSETGLYEDAHSAIVYLHSLGIPDSSMIVLGESLGAAIALEMSQQFKCAAIILQSPFKSLKDLAKKHYPWMLLPPWDKYDNAEKIKHLDIPLMIIHGHKDNLVPYAHGLNLYYNASQSPKRVLKVMKTYGHQLPWDDDYILSIQKFIQDDVFPSH